MQEYVGFIALLFALFTVSGGIAIHISRKATPSANTLLLLLGAVLANLFGTTGASMLLIRPYLRMNKGHIRPYHVVFFIFMVGNVGGCLTPVGDPPLFLGYLKGVPFWWVIEHCWQPWLVLTGVLATAFFIWDKLDHARADRHDWGAHDTGPAVRINGIVNFLLILVVVAAVFRPSLFEGIGRLRDGDASGGALLDLVFCRELVMVGTALLSLAITNRGIYEINEFKFGPIKEVAIIFVAIFSTMTPALEYLDTNAKDTLLLETPGEFYFGTGTLSSVLDNAPTYLTFLQARLAKIPDDHVVAARQAIADAYAAHLAQPELPLVSFAPQGLEPREAQLAVTEVLLEHEDHVIHGEGRVPEDELKLAFITAVPELNDYLVAISIGSVFFGAMTYIGNAPNFMIKSVAEQAGVKMPSFLGYVVRYAAPILLPVLVLVWVIFFLFG